MKRLILIFFVIASIATATEQDRTKLDVSLLAAIPTKRHVALSNFAISGRDSTPAIGEKKAKYVEALKSLIHDLRHEYYWHSEFPKDIDQAIEKRAIYLACLYYPASPTTGCSYYGDLIQNYTIRLYEEEVVTIAHEVIERTHDQDVVARGNVRSFAAWKKAWTDAGNVMNGPNQDLKRLLSYSDLQ